MRGAVYMDGKTVYSVSEIQKILGISRTSIYEYVKKVYQDGTPFRVIRIGNTYRIPIKSFNKWLDGE